MPESNSDLQSVNRILSREELLHLLNRTVFGVSMNEVNLFDGKTAEQCLDILLQPSPHREPPLQNDPDSKDPLVPDGQTWINAPYENEDIDKRRRIQLKGWWAGHLVNRQLTLTEKMVLFWHNHFVTTMDGVKDARHSYRYLIMLRKYALGNFKKLIREGTTCTAMLRYLNGNSNVKGAPNENYSRELLELFTLGKGNGVNYTEEDVREAAKVLTGWADKSNRFEAEFKPDLHDCSDKKFSEYFDGAVIQGQKGEKGAYETDELIDLIFSRKETSMFVCRNLYRWFCSSQIDEKVEYSVILPLAEILINNNFEISIVLRTLLCSKHFYSEFNNGTLTKSPVDFLIGITKQLKLKIPQKESDFDHCQVGYFFDLQYMSQDIGDPPSVAGWPAYYQTPKYDGWWLNSYTLIYRIKIIEQLLSSEGYNCDGPRIKFDALTFIKQFDNGFNADQLVNSVLGWLLPVTVSQSTQEKLKKLLFNSISPETWFHYWEQWKADEQNVELRKILEPGVNTMIKKILSSPEYQIM